jgi:hypothetical protein
MDVHNLRFYLNMLSTPTVNLRMASDRSKHVGIYSKKNLVVFEYILIQFLYY